MDIQRTLLIVDGHRGVREALVERLQRAPDVRRVVAADSLETALRMAQDHTPDVVVYEPRTIAGDAADAVRLLRQAGCPVIVLTSSLQNDEPASLRNAGAGAVLLKGVAVADLLAAIETVLAGVPRPRSSGNGVR